MTDDTRSARLVCLTGPDADSDLYDPLAASLSASIDVINLDGPAGLGDDPDGLVDWAVTAARPYTDRPFALLGHGTAAVLAFEVARRLERHGNPPIRLVVSGSRPPQRAGERTHVACPLTVLTGQPDPDVALDEAYTWQARARGGFSLRVFRGGRGFITDRSDEVGQVLRGGLLTVPATPRRHFTGRRVRP